MLRYNGPALEPLPVDHRSSMFVRIADVLDDDGSTLYELRFTGMRPGVYDLRDYLRRVDGRPHEDLPPSPVRIVGLLPENHSGDLEELAQSPLPSPWPYRVALAAVIGLWTLPLVWSIFRRLSARPERPQAIKEPKLTLADQLRPLVEAAIAGDLDKEGKARLELLLLAHWRERLGLFGYDGHAAIARMKQDSAAGELLRRLEDWLHRPPGTVEIDVERWLAPYRGAPAVNT